MPDFLLAHEAAVRSGVFVVLLTALLLLETRWPRRGGERQRRMRWTANLPMVVAGALVVRLLLRLGAVGSALWAQREGLGLFNQLAVPGAGLASFVALDLLVYWQHRLMHRVPLLWRLHRMHHSDVEFDATTALRFHPLEIAFSMLLKVGAVLALGAPPLAVLVFEAALNGTAMFNHANLTLPLALDRRLRRVLVTPDMHRVHHSVEGREYNRNFGFNFPFWDRLFGSYLDQPAAGHAAMKIGLADYREDREQGFFALLAQPFKIKGTGP